MAFPVLPVVPTPEPCGGGETTLLLQEDPSAGSRPAERARGRGCTRLWDLLIGSNRDRNIGHDPGEDPGEEVGETPEE